MDPVILIPVAVALLLAYTLRLKIVEEKRLIEAYSELLYEAKVDYRGNLLVIETDYKGVKEENRKLIQENRARDLMIIEYRDGVELLDLIVGEAPRLTKQNWTIVYTPWVERVRNQNRKIIETVESSRE